MRSTGPIRLARRQFLALTLASGAGWAVGCGRGHSPSTADPAAPAAWTGPESSSLERKAGDGGEAQPAPTATPTASPPPPAGRLELALLAGSRWETNLVVAHSGLDGPAVMILGGVHGNEPGGWMAAEELSAVQPAHGSLLVLPRANREAIEGFVRSTDELGDLNRLYPGSPTSALPMERLAAEIVEAAREFRVELLLDLHESWAFYSTRAQDGTAYLGQTVTAGVGPLNPALAAAVVDRANGLITVERDRMVSRDGSAFRRADPSGRTGSTRGRSSLSLGGHIPGLTPILVEMGQEDQAITRRVELHLLVATEALTEVGVL